MFNKFYSVHKLEKLDWLANLDGKTVLTTLQTQAVEGQRKLIVINAIYIYDK